MKKCDMNPHDIVPPAPPITTEEASASPRRSSVRQMQAAADRRPDELVKPTAGGLRRLCYDQQQMLEILPLSERTLFSMRQRGEIPFVKVRDRVLYPVDEIHAWWNGLKEGGIN
jgi:hypothetical protein